MGWPGGIQRLMRLRVRTRRAVGSAAHSASIARRRGRARGPRSAGRCRAAAPGRRRMLTASPWAKRPVPGWSSSRSTAARPLRDEGLHPVLHLGGPLRHLDRLPGDRQVADRVDLHRDGVGERAHPRAARASGGSRPAPGRVSSRYSRIASDWVSRRPSISSVGTSPCGLRARFIRRRRARRPAGPPARTGSDAEQVQPDPDPVGRRGPPVVVEHRVHHPLLSAIACHPGRIGS